ncbi:hypothetical protein VTO73DRAFT_15226 [Trametes versicolor]
MSTARPTSWLVTGASRGIGFEIVRQLLSSPTNVVVAAARTPEKATALKDLQKTAKGTLHVIKLDVSDFESIRASAKDLLAILGDNGLDYLINNAAVVALPCLEKGMEKQILHISSTGGSIGTAGHVGSRFGSYSMTKAALNMLVRPYHLLSSVCVAVFLIAYITSSRQAYKQKLERPDFTVITLCPGWVKTDMGGEGAQLEPHESVAGILKKITSATTADSGKYLRYNGETIPW